MVSPDIVFPLTVDSSAILLDGSYIAQSHKPKAVKTIGEYIESTFVQLINKYLIHYGRVDLLFDRYFSDSIKNVTRNNRGDGGRFHIVSTTPIPRNWKTFMRNSENKTELFRLIAKYAENIIPPPDKQFICTIDDKVVVCPPSVPTDNISPCTHEEVDTRILLHARDAVTRGFTSLLLKATDTDVVVVCLSLFEQIGAKCIWIEFGTSRNLRLLPIHEIHKSLGPARCRGLPFFHALTGCDTTTAFVGYGKVSAWNVWEEFEQEYTQVFSRVSFYSSVSDLSEDDIEMLETYVSSIYMKIKTFTRIDINDARKKLFLTKGISFDKLPPTKDVLYLKILRCMYQCFVWTNSLIKSPLLPSVQNYGWKLDNDSLSFVWSTLPDIVKGCWDTFVKCNCKKSGCAKNCSCKRTGEPCTTLCGCNCYE